MCRETEAPVVAKRRAVGVYGCGMAASVLCQATGSRVSSVLNRDVKQFGKKFLFDRNEETCWNSDQGPAQWVLLDFPQSVKVTELQLQFQGGFTGRTCRLQGSRGGANFMKITNFYPEDTNCLQRFSISEESIVDKLKVIFEESSDFFGRIILYHLDVLGEKPQEPSGSHSPTAEQGNEQRPA
ncbi:nuclear receptor 2C2-associated protein [Leucoraja erinacea]|uniref:nuclear receptor 2C2-associated protein n=1 Tax=Leucoraja erinaceus TaxID=7782 RepID=UPI002457AEA6|nr:nuclear receptor 2C2-associated protein [Leucoraja erinacea]